MNDIKLPAVMEIQGIQDSKWLKAKVLWINSDRTCIALINQESLLTPKDIHPNNLSYCHDFREIKESTLRAYKKNKDIECLKNLWFRLKNNSVFVKPELFDLGSKTAPFVFIGLRTPSLQELFEKWEVEIDGEWQPVGVLES